MAASADDLIRLSRHLVREGSTAWLPTVITSPIEMIEHCDRTIAEAMEQQRELERATQRGNRETPGASILGMHLEGPFISSKRLGAHPPRNLLPQGEALERVLRLKTLRLITLAPELDGALDAIPRLVACGIVVSLGHTDASYETSIKGLQAGATMLTHLFNAMPPFHHRAPGPVGAATHEPRPCVTMIPDGVHVHPSVLRLCSGLKAGFITDRVASAQAEQAPATIFGKACIGIVQDGRAARFPDGTLLGSTISMLDAARIARQELGCDWRSVEALTSREAARALKIWNRGRIAANCRADMVMVDRALKLKGVWVGGREID